MAEMPVIGVPLNQTNDSEKWLWLKSAAKVELVRLSEIERIIERNDGVLVILNTRQLGGVSLHFDNTLANVIAQINDPRPVSLIGSVLAGSHAGHAAPCAHDFSNIERKYDGGGKVAGKFDNTEAMRGHDLPAAINSHVKDEILYGVARDYARWTGNKIGAAEFGQLMDERLARLRRLDEERYVEAVRSSP